MPGDVDGIISQSFALPGDVFVIPGDVFAVPGDVDVVARDDFAAA